MLEVKKKKYETTATATPAEKRAPVVDLLNPPTPENLSEEKRMYDRSHKRKWITLWLNLIYRNGVRNFL